MKNDNKYKTLISNTALISIGTFGSKLLVFFMVRFYTTYLTPDEYGTADLIMQTANLLLPLISLGIVEGVFRYTMDKNLDKRSVFTTGLTVITSGTLFFAVIAPILNHIKWFDGYVLLIALFTISSCYHSLCAQFIRAQGKTALFAAQGILNTALVIGMNILFLVGFHWGITGYVLSVVLADAICALFLFFKEKLYTQITAKPDMALFKKMVRYSIPLIPTTVFWWITSVSDRYMVKYFISSAANGIYAVSYKVPTLLSMISSIFIEAWQFSAVTEAQGGKDEHVKFYSQVWRSFQAVMFVGGVFIIAFAKIEVSILSTPQYFEAWRYIPVLAMAMVFAGFTTFMGSVYLVTKKSVLSFATAMIGALINIVVNFVLIPTSLQIQGAAIATFACYFIVFFIRTANARKYIPFKMYAGTVVANTVIITAQTVYMVAQWKYWQAVQIVAVVAILLINFAPLLTSAKRVFSMFGGILKRHKK